MTLSSYDPDLTLPPFASREVPVAGDRAGGAATATILDARFATLSPTARMLSCRPALFSSGGHYAALLEVETGELTGEQG